MRGIAIAAGVVFVVLAIGRTWLHQASGGREKAPPPLPVRASPSASTSAVAKTRPPAPPVLVEPALTTLNFRIPPEGTDYDSAEFEWVKPLEGESAPVAPPTGFAVPLTGQFPSCRLLTGYYRMTLKNIALKRVGDFIASAALPVRAEAGAFPLPGTMSRRYVGYVGARRGPPGESPVAVFCAAQVDVRAGTGELMIVFDEPKVPLDLDYAGLRPRPDNAWPITNVFLEDAARLSFDCPLSHVDHRVVIDRSDGLTTLLAEPVPPEDDTQLASLLQRMRDLLKAQAKTAAAHPGRFDPRFRGLPADGLPNAEHFRTLTTFGAYVKRVTSGRPQAVELGDSLRVLKGGSDGWEVRALRGGER